MKHIILAALFLLNISSYAQSDNKSLLWKITNKNTQKSSYLYGTMHISGRLAFHLGEEFFDAIESTDAVALESNPIIWLDEIFSSPYASDYLGRYGFFYQTYKGFYQSAFDLTIPDNDNISGSISSDHYLSNWMLYRENKSQLDFQEETFLDLFIYQVGMKTKRKVYSLEDFKQTTHFSKMGNMVDPNKKDKDAWYEKLTEDKSARDLITEAYRNKDVYLLDSLHQQINSANFTKYMLVQRNEIMAARIDSFIQKEDISLFIGIGAAHLAGENGVITLLQNMGYTVEAVSTTITDETKERKKRFDEMKVPVTYDNYFKSENFSVKVPGTLYETPSGASYQRQFFSPELSNGAFYSIKQLSTYSYLKNISQSDYQSKLDSLLFESIPGDIVSKKWIEKNGYKGLDLVNKTTTGNIQRYQFFLTPINIFIFKMGGKEDFVSVYGDDFFNSIQLTNTNTEWIKYQSVKHDFEVKAPGNHTTKGNTLITSLYDQTELEAYDPSDKNYYFLKRTSLYDYNFIEEDAYELNRLADQFCENLDIDSVETTVLNDTKYPTALAYTYTADSNYLALKIVIRGPYYYLLGNVSPTKKESNPFFDSFEFTNWTFHFPFETKVDSTLMFKTKSNYLWPNVYTDYAEKAENIRKENLDKVKEDNSHESFKETRRYYSENFDRIKVEMYKFNDYAEYENIDSLWKWEGESIARENKLIEGEKTLSEKDGVYSMEMSFTDTNSVRMIKTKMVLKQGVLFTMTALTDTIEKSNEFIDNFFNHFEPLDTIVGLSIFDDKSKMFFDALNHGDSLEKEHAYKATESYIRFDETDVDDLFKVIKDYPFPAKHIDVKADLIGRLGYIEDKRIVPFLTELYPVVEDTAMYQVAIIKGLARQKDKKAYEAITKLLDYDIPLSNSKWGMYSTFYPFYDSLEISKELFPNLLNFTFVEDYKDPTYYLLTTMVEKHKIKGKDYKSKYKQILREAKIELKAQISYEQNEQTKDNSDSYYYSSYKNKGNTRLVNYSVMLIPFYKKSAVQDYFLKLNKVTDYQVRTEIYSVLLDYGIEVPSSVWKELAADQINRNYLYSVLKKIDRLDVFPAEYLTQNLMVESMLYEKNFNIEKDSMEFVTKKLVYLQNDSGYVYFYKSKSFKDDDWELDYTGLQPMDSTQVNINDVVFEKGTKIEKHKTIDEIIDEELESIQLQGHFRAKKRSKSNGYNWFW